MNKKPKQDEQEIYGDIPADRPMSQEYLDAVLPDHVKAKIAERKGASEKPVSKEQPKK
jgi:hypothetical protein